MNLWVRSQDKMILKKINSEIYLKYSLSDYAEGNVYSIISGGTKLGEYKTKQRALEVLNEITKLLNPVIIFKSCKPDEIKSIPNIVNNTIVLNSNASIQELGSYVYEMPND